VERASLALRVHCAELLLERGHGKPAQAIAIADGSEGGKSLRDLILASMALDGDEPKTIEHEPAEDDDEL
jgi:hypothetical protein